VLAFVLWLTTAASVIWLLILGFPWFAWRTTESLDADPSLQPDLTDTTAIIPARNEAECIVDTLQALAAQGDGLQILLIDDQSSDGTAAIAESLSLANLHVIAGEPPPPGWSGKLWALQQGLQHVEREYILLLDADIQLDAGMLATLRHKLDTENRALVSVMAQLRMVSFWECALLPAFIFFFKLLYPFKLANSSVKWFAAAAGGCILTRASVLHEVGAFAAIKGALIDDVTLARRIKQHGHATWIGLTHSAHSIRKYELTTIWNMVARTAYTQLAYSLVLLLLCTVLMATAYLFPVVGLLVCLLGDCVPTLLLVSSLSLLMMFATFAPTLRYYRRPLLWGAALPLIAAAYLAMSWTSALRYWRGERSRWKGRAYNRMNQ